MSLIHYLTIGFFDLRSDHLNPGKEPMPLRQLDRSWVEAYLNGVEAKVEEAFWFGDSGCLWGTLSWFEHARSIVDHHGPGCVAVHQNEGLVIYPADGINEQRRANGWETPNGVA